jgi:transcriptional regulator with XRE-family HTH domain
MLKKEDIIARINSRIEQSGESPLSVSKRSGVGKDIVYNLLGGRTAMPSWDRLDAIRRVLKLDENFLPIDGDIVSHIGFVSGRDEVGLFSDNEEFHAEIDWPAGRWDVLSVQTDQLAPGYDYGDLLLMGEHESDFHRIADRMCLVCLQNGNLMLRKVTPEQGGQTVTLTLGSAPVLTHCKIETAQPVEWVKKNFQLKKHQEK